MNDIEVILKALQRERDELHQQLMQVDRIINRVKSGTYSDKPVIEQPVKQLEAKAIHRPKTLSPILDLKIQVLRAMDVLNVASTLKQIQAEYSAMSENKYNIRESVRALQKQGIIRLITLHNRNVRLIFPVEKRRLGGLQLVVDHSFRPRCDYIYVAALIHRFNTFILALPMNLLS